jgi:hypothetical protein
MAEEQSSKPEPPSELIPRLVGEVLETSPIELPPLFDTVDPEGLDAVAESSAFVHLRYAGCDVTISDGVVSVQRVATGDVVEARVDWSDADRRERLHAEEAALAD